MAYSDCWSAVSNILILYVGLEGPMLARLVLTPSKLASLAGGLRQIAATCKNVLGQVKRHTTIAEVTTPYLLYITYCILSSYLFIGAPSM